MKFMVRTIVRNFKYLPQLTRKHKEPDPSALTAPAQVESIMTFVTRNFNLLMISRKLTKARKYLPSVRRGSSRKGSGRSCCCGRGKCGCLQFTPNNTIIITIIICIKAFSCFVLRPRQNLHFHELLEERRNFHGDFKVIFRL